MSEIVIKAENISKQYQLGKIGYGTLKHDLQSWFAKIRGKDDPNQILGMKRNKDLNEDFWALKDVSFEIKQGDAVGIIGKNGAGKSTLLKILSRTTTPTTGEIKIKGKIASLLEVGTGFHPELTGRENIYLNGAILGMRKKEIDRKLDEIVDFSGIEKFIDTPVKRYSSGMYVRLAFAVAAHLDSDILVLDEVLAVGDAEFQKKCLGKMDEVAKKQGRTVLFVSHFLQAVQQLCSNCIYLSDGMILEYGKTDCVIMNYLSKDNGHFTFSERDLSSQDLRTDFSEKESLFKWTSIKVINSKNEPNFEINYGESFEVIIKGFISETCTDVLIGFGFRTKFLGYIFTSHQIYNNITDVLKKGWHEFKIKIDQNILAPGIYEVYIAADGNKIKDHIPVSLEIKILDYGNDSIIKWTKYKAGIVDYPCVWTYRHIE